LPNAYISPTKSSKSNTRNKAPKSSQSYVSPDVWTPSGEEDGIRNSSSSSSHNRGRTGSHRGPDKVFGRRATNGRMGTPTPENKHETKNKTSNTDNNMKDSKRIQKIISTSPAVGSPSVETPPPSSTKKKSIKGGSGKKMTHARSATMMHPPPTELNDSIVEEEEEEEEEENVEHLKDMEDIDRVLEELRSVTTEDDKVGYSSKKKKKGK